MDEGKRYFDSEEFKKIIKKYEQMKAENICSYFETDELTNLLIHFLYYERYGEAEALYAYAKRLHPTNKEFIDRLDVRMLLARGRAKEALEILDKGKLGDDFESQILRAEILIELKEYKAAQNAAMNILKQQKLQNDEIYDALTILLDCGFAQEALHIIEEWLQRRPTLRMLHEVKAECLIELQQTDEAIDIYNKLLDHDPYSTFYWEQLGRIYYLIERYGKALECFEYELTIDESIEYAKMMQGYCYYRLRDYKSAIGIFEYFRNKYPQSIVPRFYTALAKSYLDDRESAIDEYDAVIEIIGQQEVYSIEAMLAYTNKTILLNEEGMSHYANATLSSAIEHILCNDRKQLMLNNGRYYELRDKENMTYRDMSTIEVKEWKLCELLFSYGTFFLDKKLYCHAFNIFSLALKSATDTAEISAYVAYSKYCIDSEAHIIPYVKEALIGKSNKLFELFAIPYDANISPEEFMNKIKGA
ncbi:MAG: tetratricopeptide repeat protein [Bacteroidaceae bacterium]|nr:tetratricopeptide repeat protein [Bacteroidaceae bacterium]